MRWRGEGNGLLRGLEWAGKKMGEECFGEGKVGCFECREVVDGIGSIWGFECIGGVLCFEGAVGGVGVEDLETEFLVLEKDGT